MKNNLCSTHTKQFIGFIAILFLFVSCDKSKSSQIYSVNEKTSQVEWKGYLENGEANTGTFSITGNLSTDENGNIKEGNLKIPIASLKNTNLPNEDLRRQIVGHLQSQDFFNMAVYPNAEFSFSALEKTNGQETLIGELTLLGKTMHVSVPVKIVHQDESIQLSGNLSINRLDWGMNYASDPNATNGMYIKPEVDLSFNLNASHKID